MLWSSRQYLISEPVSDRPKLAVSDTRNMIWDNVRSVLHGFRCQMCLMISVRLIDSEVVVSETVSNHAPDTAIVQRVTPDKQSKFDHSQYSNWNCEPYLSTCQNSCGGESGDLGASPPQLFGRGGDRPRRPHGVGAYGQWKCEKALRLSRPNTK